MPKYPPELKGKPHKLSVACRQIKIFHRREMMRRMGLSADENQKSFQICEYHNFAHETHWVNVMHGNKSWSQRCKLTLPANIGPKSTAIESNKSLGLAYLQQILQSKLLQRWRFHSAAWLDWCWRFMAWSCD